MAKLIYITNVSLDGYIEDDRGRFDWSEPGDDYFAFITDLIRPIGTHLYGRRLYDSMAVWETDPALAAESELTGEFAKAWQDSDKVVYSTAMDAASTTRTRVERTFDPDAVRHLKASTGRDLMIGGAELAGHAFRAGLVDEYQVFIYPVLVGGGKPSLPRGTHVELELLDERRFSRGVVYLRYAVRRR
ncbi:MAG: dihydrofolate reductase family protein [Actinomycetota bacterium]|nr:dihydrofolate reductase family protein [Actinomycetota bacterium]